MTLSSEVTHPRLKWETDRVEAADPAAFEWYVRQFGPEVNRLVDNLQIVELECMRSGLWGKKLTWGRIAD